MEQKQQKETEGGRASRTVPHHVPHQAKLTPSSRRASAEHDLLCTNPDTQSKGKKAISQSSDPVGEIPSLSGKSKTLSGTSPSCMGFDEPLC